MSYRLSLYKVKKERLEEIKDWTDKEFEYDSDGEPLGHGYEYVDKMVYFDEFNEICRENEERIWSRVFVNKLSCECDMCYMYMGREQFKVMIDMIRHHIKKRHMLNDNINAHNEEFDKLFKGEIGVADLEKKYQTYVVSVDKCNLLEKIGMMLQDEWMSNRIWNIYYGNDEKFWEYVDDNGKNKVSFTDDWKSCLCNLIYLYRTMDWENERILFIGG